jgi:hypothetical protein
VAASENLIDYLSEIGSSGVLELNVGELALYQVQTSSVHWLHEPVVISEALDIAHTDALLVRK